MKSIARRRFLGTAAAAGAAVALKPRRSYSMANDEIRLAFIACGGRAGEHMSTFSKLPGVKVVGLCDPDESRVAAAQKRFPDAKTWTDLRGLIDDKEIDAVVAAPCNHWHCLASIWAMQSGKDVYVEKPLSHSQWEGQQTINAARKYKRICQVGTQQRSDPMQAEIKKFLHQDQSLGKILSARVNRYGVRAPIGKLSKPLVVDSNVHYDLWLGPAQDQPIFREKLQYDWHWDWNTGSGEMGNWGVHVLDDLRNNVFLDKVTLPKRIFGGGGRVAWNDAGETPNIHFVYFDTGSIPVVIGLSNMTEGTSSKKSPPHPGPGSGYIAYCEGGRLEGQRGSAVAYDSAGKQMAKFSGKGGNGLHQENFLAAVRSRDSSILNTDVQIGHHSTGWCNLANIAFRAGSHFTQDRASEIKDPNWGQLLEEMQKHLAAHGSSLSNSEIKLSPVLEVDTVKEEFVGTHAEVANRFLKREYRAPFVVPEITI
jgi:hypothetical protein